MSKYVMENYFSDIDKKGLKKTWHSILTKTLENDFSSDIFTIENYGELYEIGLEHENKLSKKEMGKYYTPKDVAIVMAKWLQPLRGEKLCDVGCGTGNLILPYLELLGENLARKLINDGNLFLYDLDEIALEICKYSIAIKYGKDLLTKINAKVCDFLSEKVKLPQNSKVISNPPYYKISTIGADWKVTKVVEETRELYSAFVEKIISQSETSVIITPYSFIGSGKFYALRQVMNDYNGFVVAFDNVPGNIFNGKKHGIFNTNKGNSVRAAITVVENKKGVKGFRISPLIRFKTEERKRLLENNYLESLVNECYQLVNQKQKAYFKCPSDLLRVLDKWEEVSDKRLKDLLNSSVGQEIFMPTTCRYFTVGAKRALKRDGKRVLHVADSEKYNYVYCLLNSTFAYWYWRLYDGGINCPLSIINNLPVFYNRLTGKQKAAINEIAKQMQKNEEKYLVYKMNAGKKQENVKFPPEYRNRINKIFLEALGIDEEVSIFDQVHSSSLFGKNVEVQDEV